MDDHAPPLVPANDLWLLCTRRRRKAGETHRIPGDQMHGNFSPAVGLVAYTSNESGRFEVYVETVPRSDRKWPVSTNGGYEPRGGRMGARSITSLKTASSWPSRRSRSVFGIPKPLFQTQFPPV